MADIIKIKTRIVGAAKASQRINSWKQKMPQVVDRAMKRQALRLMRMVVKGIRSGAPGGKEFEPLAESTIMMKGSSKPLIDKGDLVGSIGIEEIGSGDGYFVGVNRNAVDGEGNNLANIAEIMETGTDPYTITVTPAMRGFMLYKASQGKVPKAMAIGLLHKAVINHPGLKPRPFLEPTVEEWEQDAEDKFAEDVRRGLGL